MRLLWLYENIKGYSFDGLSTCDPKNIERETSISSLNAIDFLRFNFKFPYYILFFSAFHAKIQTFFFLYKILISTLLIILILKNIYIYIHTYFFFSKVSSTNDTKSLKSFQMELFKGLIP